MNGMEMGRPIEILLAEDNAVNQQIALLMLEGMGYRADVAANGMEAVELVSSHPYDVVLMDVQMPEMDGYEATRAIRALEGAFAGIPIVAMTANAFAEDRAHCLAAGMNDYLGKPILVEALVASRKDDVRRGVSTVGPHRDDIELRIGGMPARTHASQGEQRSLALALREKRDAAVDALRKKYGTKLATLDDRCVSAYIPNPYLEPRALKAAGVCRGDRVAFIGLNQPAFFETMFAAARLGAIDNPDHRKVHDEPVPRLGGLADISGGTIDGQSLAEWTASRAAKL